MGGPVGRGRRGGLGSRLSGLPRRRRILGIAVTAIVLAGAVGIAVATSRGGQSGQGHVGAHQAVPPQTRPGPVLLVPGYGGSNGSLDSLASRIRATGRAATVITLPGA